MRFRLTMFLLLSALASAQTAVDMGSKPHSSLLLQNASVRVFRMSLNANDQAYVLHKHNFLLVALDDCELALWREGQSSNQSFPFKVGDVRFYFEGPPIGTRNDRASLCRTMVIELLDPKVTTYGYQWWDNAKWDYGINGIPAPVDPQENSPITCGWEARWPWTCSFFRAIPFLRLKTSATNFSFPLPAWIYSQAINPESPNLWVR